MPMKLIVAFQIIAFFWEISVICEAERTSRRAVALLEANSFIQRYCTTPMCKALCSQLWGVYEDVLIAFFAFKGLIVL